MANETNLQNLNGEDIGVEESVEASLLPTGERNETEHIISPVIGDPDCTFNNIIQILDPSTSRNLIDKWTDVARILNIRPETVVSEKRSLFMETKGISDVYLTMLIEWRGVNSTNATLHTLENLFRRYGFYDAAAKIRMSHIDLFDDIIVNLRKQRQSRIIQGAMIAVFTIASILGICLIEIPRYTPVLYRNSVPPIPTEYISRELATRAEMSTDKIFRSEIRDNVLVFSGIDEYQVQELVKYGNTIQITTTLSDKSISLRYITGLQLVSEFDELCEIRRSLSVHWLRYEIKSKSFRWMDSCGTSMTFIQNAVNSTGNIIQERFFGELNFFVDDKAKYKYLKEIQIKHEVTSTGTVLRQPIIIYGSSGTGKSTLLASIGEAIQSFHADAVVVFADFAAFLQDVSTQNKNSNVYKTTALVNTVTKIACKNWKCRNHLLSQISAGAVKLAILLDAVDQVTSENINLGVDLLRELKTWNSTLLFITTRPNYLSRLETALNSMAYMIEPFSLQKQTEYLVKFWYQGHQYLDHERLHNYSSACINTIQSRLSKQERDFTGIALLTYFMANLYQENATVYADPKNAASTGYPRIEFTSVYHLYERLVSNRLSRFTHDVTKYKRLQIFHVYTAIHTKFPNQIMPNFTLPVGDILKIGILEMSSDGSNNLEFIHPTFVDYFVAWYTLTCNISSPLCRSVFNNSLDVEKGNVFYGKCKQSRKMSYSFAHKLVTYFWDASPSLENIEKLFSTVEYRDDVVYASVGDDFMNLFFTFYNSSLVAENNSEFLEDLVFHSVMHSNLPLVRHIVSDFISKSGKPFHTITLCENYNNTSYLEDLDILKLSARRGDFEIFSYVYQYLENKILDSF